MKAKKLHILLIINPISGTESKSGLKEQIEKRLRSMGHIIDTAVTQKAGDATVFAKEAVDKGYDIVLACGGDGTVNETARGLIGSNVVLGILPNGSGNGLARHIDLPIDPIASLKAIKHGKITDCDYCTVNGTPFFCTFGLGFDAAVSQRFAMSKKRGLMTYLKSAYDEFIHYQTQSYKISIADKTLDVNAFLIACCNASQYGNNAFIAPTASITDGLLDVTLVHSGNPISRALVGIELLAGAITNGGIIDTFRTDKITIERSAPGIAHIDGEPIELPEKLEIICHHGGLKIISPRKKLPFRPILTPIYLLFKDCRIRLAKRFA